MSYSISASLTRMSASTVRTRRRTIVVAAIVAVVGGAVVIKRTSNDGGLQHLHSAIASSRFRTLEGRLSEATAWQPLASTRRRVTDLQVVFAAVAILNREEPASFTEKHGRALAKLITGAATAAAADLEAIAPLSSVVADWNDLSVATLEIATKRQDPSLLVDALFAADRALMLAPHDAAALFNRAVILDRLGLHAVARGAWVEFLRIENDPHWIDEALGRLHPLSPAHAEADWRFTFDRLGKLSAAQQREAVTAAATLYPQYARRWGETVVLGAWADAVLRHDVTAAANYFRLAHFVGEAIQPRNGDSMLQSVVDDIERRQEKGTAEVLARGVVAYRDGRLAYGAGRPVDAERQLRRAEALLRDCHSPLAMWARYYVASALNAQYRIVEAAAILDGLRAQHPASHGYKALDAQIGWERGSAYIRSGALSDALETFVRSRDAFASLGETDSSAAMAAAAALVLDWAGDARSAWMARVRALEEFSRSGNDARALVVLEEAAQASSARHQWDRAEALRNVSSTLAERVGNAAVAAFAWSSRALVAAQRGDVTVARSSIAAARRWTVKLTDPRLAHRARADLAFAEGSTLASSLPSAALAKLNDALRLYGETSTVHEAPAIYLARAHIERRLSMMREAQSDVDAGLALVRLERHALREPERRSMLVEGANALFDAGIGLALDSGNAERAFALCEEQRARSLSDRFILGIRADEGEAALMSAREISLNLPDDAAIIEFAALPDRFVTFVVRADGLHHIVIPMPIDRVARTMATFRATVLRSDAGALRVCSETHDVILARVLSFLVGVRHLAIVADDRVGTAPFGALFDVRRGQFLVERMTVSIAPSATMLMGASSRWCTRVGLSLAIVGANVFDHARYPEAQMLPQVPAEARSVARLYRRSETLIGTEATVPHAIAAMKGNAIVHFAGHIAPVGTGTAEPALLLAPSGNSRSELRASDVVVTQLNRTRLVVLSACRSATAPQRNDGTGSIAFSFIAAGVPAIVATLADLDDSFAALVTIALHRHIAAGEEPLDAVAAVARQAIRDSHGSIQRSMSWANLVFIGGSRHFVHQRQERWNRS